MKSECTACGKIFNSVAGFDKHRTGEYGNFTYAPNDRHRQRPVGREPITRRCMTTEEMQAIGMSQNGKGWWIASEYNPSAHQDKEDEVEAAD